MFLKLFQAVSAGFCGLLMITLIIFATSIPEVTYSTTTVEYKNGYPEIALGDIVEVRSSSGEILPQSEWQNVLASGRFDPVPSEER